MKIDRAISISVKPRARCTAGNYSFRRKSQQRPRAFRACLTLIRQQRGMQSKSIYSTIRGVTVNYGKGDRLHPPDRIGVIAEKGIHEPGAKFARAYQILAKFFHRLCPIIRPWTGPVVDCSFCGATDFLETQCRQPRRQGTTDLVIDSTLARPCKPTTPERTHFRRFCDRNRKEIRFNQEDGAAGPHACSEIRDCLFGVGNMVKHRTSSHEVETPRLTGSVMISTLRNSRFGKCTSTSERSRSTAMARPSGATCRASHAEIEPLPQPTSSVLAPDLTTSSD